MWACEHLKKVVYRGRRVCPSPSKNPGSETHQLCFLSRRACTCGEWTLILWVPIGSLNWQPLYSPRQINFSLCAFSRPPCRRHFFKDFAISHTCFYQLCCQFAYMLDPQTVFSNISQGIPEVYFKDFAFRGWSWIFLREKVICREEYFWAHPGNAQ